MSYTQYPKKLDMGAAESRWWPTSGGKLVSVGREKQIRHPAVSRELGIQQDSNKIHITRSDEYREEFPDVKLGVTKAC